MRATLLFLYEMRQYYNTEVRQIPEIVNKNDVNRSIYFLVLQKAIIVLSFQQKPEKILDNLNNYGYLVTFSLILY